TAHPASCSSLAREGTPDGIAHLNPMSVIRLLRGNKQPTVPRAETWGQFGPAAYLNCIKHVILLSFSKGMRRIPPPLRLRPRGRACGSGSARVVAARALRPKNLGIYREFHINRRAEKFFMTTR